MDREDVIDLLSIISAIDHRSVGEMDIGVWTSMLFGRVSKDDCVTAIMAHFAEQPGVWLTPGHVVQRVKAMVNDRIARQPELPAAPPASAQVRVAAMAKLSDLIGRDPGPSGGDVLYVNVLVVACDFCRAGVGERCSVPVPASVVNREESTRSKGTKPAPRPEQLRWIPGHPSRIVKAAIAAGHSAEEAEVIAGVATRRQARRAAKAAEMLSEALK